MKSQDETQDVPIPIAVQKYNSYMGGVDKSDQFISYNRISRKTVWYWKTFFYHLLEIVTTNSSIIHNWIRMEQQRKSISQTEFHDWLVQQIIAKYGRPITNPNNLTVVHCSQFRRGAYCQSNQTQCYCPDCPYETSLCQVSERDCHSIWHRNGSSTIRKRWFKNNARSHSRASVITPTTKQGRPTGSRNNK